MKILHTVESYIPDKNGMSTVVQEISERLVQLGHQITIVTSKNKTRKYHEINGVKIIEFDISGNYVKGYTGDKTKYKKFLLDSNFDIVTFFAAQQWATDIALPILKQIKGKKVFVPTGFSALYLPKYKKYFEYMEMWMKDFDMNVFLSNNYRDMNFARDNKIQKITIIPNGASEEEFLPETRIDIRKKLNIPKDHFLILLVGSHTWQKGHLEAMLIFQKAKLRNATLLIVGKKTKKGCQFIEEPNRIIFNLSPKRLKDKKRILIKDLTRKEIIACYKSADLFLFPSNIECSPIVLFEAMASKLPFLVTDVGNSKEIISWSNGGLLLPTIRNHKEWSFAHIERSAKILEDIWGDPNLRNKLGENGFNSWKEKFTWKKIAQKYEELYKTLIIK